MPSSTLPSRSLNSRLVPHLHRAVVAVLLLADPHAFGIVAVRAERRGAGGADPFVAALVAALLLFEALAQGLHELVPAHGLDLLLLFLGEIFLRELLQPLLGNLGLVHRIEQVLQPLEHGAEHAVELVEIALVLHQRGARQIVEILHRLVGEVGVQRLHQRQIFAQGHGDLRVAQRCEELQKHGLQIARRQAQVKAAQFAQTDRCMFSLELCPRGIQGGFPWTCSLIIGAVAASSGRSSGAGSADRNIVIGIIGRCELAVAATGSERWYLRHSARHSSSCYRR